MKISLIALTLSFSVACGGSSSPPPAAPAADEPGLAPAVAEETPASSGASMEELGEAAIAMMEAMARGAAEHRGDCDAQADALQRVVDDNAAVMTEMKQADGDPAKKQYFEETYGERAMQIMGGMMGDLMPCEGNEKLQKVFESFE